MVVLAPLTHRRTTQTPPTTPLPASPLLRVCLGYLLVTRRTRFALNFRVTARRPRRRRQQQQQPQPHHQSRPIRGKEKWWYWQTAPLHLHLRKKKTSTPAAKRSRTRSSDGIPSRWLPVTSALVRPKPPPLTLILTLTLLLVRHRKVSAMWPTSYPPSRRYQQAGWRGRLPQALVGYHHPQG